MLFTSLVLHLYKLIIYLFLLYMEKKLSTKKCLRQKWEARVSWKGMGEQIMDLTSLVVNETK